MLSNRFNLSVYEPYQFFLKSRRKPSTEMFPALKPNVKALLSVAEIEKQKLNYAEKFI